MVAVLKYIDGFGADTKVVGIYKNLEDATVNHGNKFQYKEFEFGKVEFDIYDCKTYDGEKKQKNKKRK